MDDYVWRWSEMHVIIATFTEEDKGFFFLLFFISWRLITLQYGSGW